MLRAAASATTTLCLINAERHAHGVKPVRHDAKLYRAAIRHSRDMVAKRYFAHESRSGARFSARIARTGWMNGRGRWAVGENLGWGSGTQATPRSIVAAWMHSAGHRAQPARPALPRHRHRHRQRRARRLERRRDLHDRLRQLSRSTQPQRHVRGLHGGGHDPA